MTALQWDVAFDGPQDKIGHVSDLALEFLPGVSNESYRFKCGPQYVESGPRPAIWSGAFGMSWASACRPASSGGDSGDQLAEGEIPPEVLALIPPGLLPGQGPSAPTGPSVSAPSVGGLISPSVPGLCSAGRGWQVSGGDEFASMEWDRSNSGIHDEGSFTLYHTPN